MIPDENELYFFSTHWITNIQYSNHVLYFNFEDYKLWLRFSKHILSNSTTKKFFPPKKKKKRTTKLKDPNPKDIFIVQLFLHILIPKGKELYFFSTHWITNIQYSNPVLYFNFEDYKLWLRFSKHILSNSTTKFFKKKKKKLRNQKIPTLKTFL